MPFDPWKDINEKILACRKLKTPKARIVCLEKLFGKVRDGMVANVLGEEYESVGDIDSARKYFKIAEELFPLQDYKNQARRSLSRLDSTPIGAPPRKRGEHEPPPPPLALHLENYDPEKTLLVVGCTKTKIWDIVPDAPFYVPARFAYRGQGFYRFLIWAESSAIQLDAKGFRWVVLSAKYGFIDPWHPIANYDIAMDDEGMAVSVECLKGQARQVRPPRAGLSKIKTRPLADFETVICINCPKLYFESVRAVFPDSKVISI